MADLKQTPEEAMEEAKAGLAEELARAKVAIVEVAQKAMRDSALAFEARKALPQRGDDLVASATLAIVADTEVRDDCELGRSDPVSVTWNGHRFRMREQGLDSHNGPPKQLPAGRYRFLFFALPLDEKR